MAWPHLAAMLLGPALAVGGGVVLHSRLRARAVTRVLAPEIAGLRWQAAALAAELTRRHRCGELVDVSVLRAWPLSSPSVFPAVGADLGYLSREAVGRIGYFYSQLAAARERLALAASEGGLHPTPYRLLSLLVRPVYDVLPWVQPHLDLVAADIADLTDACRLLEELEAAAEEPLSEAYLWTDCCHPLGAVVDGAGASADKARRGVEPSQ